jgi:hypothetical protein
MQAAARAVRALSSGDVPPLLSALPPLDLKSAAERLKGVALHTPLQLSRTLSKRYGARVYLKREDIQVVRAATDGGGPRVLT